MLLAYAMCTVLADASFGWPCTSDACGVGADVVVLFAVIV
jgi:hypothetical protein